MNSNNIEIDNALLAKLKMKIFLMEKENFKTKRLSDNDMTERIRKLIQSEVGRNDN